MKKRIKIICVCGARPNFVKVAPLVQKFKKSNFILLHTGQHYSYEMSGVFFKELGIPKPDYNLGVGSGFPSEQTAKMMEKIEKIFLKEKPDLVIVIGDVNSTLAGALAAVKLNIKLCHIEAGLRSYDRRMPEEINRILVDHISDLLFCPTKAAVDNLKKEGITRGVYNTGDIMYDIFLKNAELAEKKLEVLEKIGVKPKDYMLLTIHRASNTNDLKKFKSIIGIIAKTGEQIVFPCHPRTKNKLKEINVSKYKNIKIIDPVGYLEMLVLERNSKKIITDSGGVQKEAYWLKVPCITMRENTEWVETIKENWNVLVGDEESKIIKAVRQFNPSKKQHKLFGDGNSAKKMAEIIINGKF